MLRVLLTNVLLLCVPLAAQTITLAEGTTSSLTIVSLPESNPNAAGTTVVQDIELLPIEITGRYLGQESDASRSRRLDRNSVVRVELPDGGRLLRFKRAGGTHWGFVHVAGNGSASVVLEQPGIAFADPFEDRIGVARNGSHFSVPLLAGGLFVVRLDGNNYASTGTASRLIAPLAIAEPTSVMVGDQVVWFQDQLLQVFRCGLGDGATPTNVSPPAQPNAILKDQMAMSGDGSRIVFLYGPQQQQRLWTVGLAGGANVLPPPPSKYEDPGYLPEESGSPALMLNEAGTRLFYIDSDIRDELYLLDTSGTLPTLQITSDPIFQPYIGVHILPGFLANDITIAIGDPNMMDWFRAVLSATGGTVTNLTATGSGTQPFPEGTIDPQTMLRTQGVSYSVEQGTNGLNIRRIDLATGAQMLLHSNATQPPFRGGGSAGSADLIVPTTQGDRLYSSSATTPLFALPNGLRLSPSSRGPNLSAIRVTLSGTSWGIPAFYLPNGTFVTGALEFDIKQLCATNLNAVVMMVGTSARYIAPGMSTMINRPAASWRRCLSGAGA
ncbi:MAG: hypothetical protein ACI8UD_002305 [Planctomycetota bacterium]|jgi:hypothetical protein